MDSHAGGVAAVTHRLYSAPRNKFSGFLHTLHSVGRRQRERNAGEVDTEPPRHTSKGSAALPAIRLQLHQPPCFESAADGAAASEHVTKQHLIMVSERKMTS